MAMPQVHSADDRYRLAPGEARIVGEVSGTLSAVTYFSSDD
jgi:hypothetical protein